jgi:CheY-like chemotaxis protein
VEQSLVADGGSKTVLIVDDELGIVEVLEFILGDAGFRVISALNGEDALARLKQDTPDLIVLDLMMPIMGGAEVLKAMRRDRRYSTIPVILTSALPEDTVRDQCGGAYTLFVRKPFKSQQILDAIARFLAPNSKPTH